MTESESSPVVTSLIELQSPTAQAVCEASQHTPESALMRYATGDFAMTDECGEFGWYQSNPRSLLSLTEDASLRRRRKFRRSLNHAGDWTFSIDRAFDDVFAGCSGENRGEHWMTQDIYNVYMQLTQANAIHSFEVWDNETLIAGVIGVTLGKAAMLESMFHRRSHAGSTALVWTLDALYRADYRVCDVQLSTPHLARFGSYDMGGRDYTNMLRHTILAGLPVAN